MSPPDPSKPEPAPAPSRTSTSLKKRGILKGWGGSSKAAAKTLAHVAERAPVHSRSESTTSLSARGLKATPRAESWVSVSGDSAVIPSPSPTPDSSAADHAHASEMTNAAARHSRSTLNSLRLPLSPILIESSGRQRLSIEDVLTPRTSQLDIVPPALRQEVPRI